MFWLRISFYLLYCFYLSASGLDIKEFLGNEPLTPRKIAEDVLQYFQQEDPKGIPVLQVPDVIHVEGPLEITTMQLTLNDLKISGHSNMSLEYVDVNLEKLQFQLRLNFPKLEILGDHYWIGYFSNSEGKMNITFVNLDIGAICDFGVNEEGLIQVMKIEVIFDPEEFLPDFTGLNFAHSVTVSAADTLFSTMVTPAIRSRVNDKALPLINERLQERLREKPFPIDISPVDFLVAKLRSDFAREKKLDPFQLDLKEVNAYGLTLVLQNIEFRGLSTLHRSDMIRTEFVDNRIYVRIEIGTQQLRGSSDWSLYSSLLPLGSGHVDLTVESFRVALEAQQDMDLRHPPIIRQINIELGNIALRSAGERNVDYMLEAAVNIFPNIFRDVIMDKKVEGMVKKKIQERFNTLNLQHIIYDQLEKMNNKPLSF